MANEKKQTELLYHIVGLISTELGVNLYDFEVVLAERENLSLLEPHVFNVLAGYVVRLTSLFCEYDLEPVHPLSKSQTRVDHELNIVVKYCGTLTVAKLMNKHDEMYRKIIELRQTTCKTWNKDFLTLLNIIIFFDYKRDDSCYRDLSCPLAQACISIVHDYFCERNDENGEDETT